MEAEGLLEKRASPNAQDADGYWHEWGDVEQGYTHYGDADTEARRHDGDYDGTPHARVTKINTRARRRH